MVRRAVRLIRSFGLLVLFLVAALLGTASGVIFASMNDLPQIAALEDYNPGSTTTVRGRDGSIVDVLSSDRREIVTYDQIPPVLRNAIISAEDADYFHHGGVNFKRIFATIVKRAVGLQRSGGASTLTQMLARGLFLTPEQTPERKIKEIILAIQIEKAYTKEQILTMFCNKILLGGTTYGVGEASQLYFGKNVRDLTLDEAAVIAGIIQTPNKQNPYANVNEAKRRRDYTLDRMAAEGYITATEATAAKKRPVVTVGRPITSNAPYFRDKLKVDLEEKYGAKTINEGGLVIQTGLDPKLQRVANAALDEQLRMMDKARGYRKPTTNYAKEGTDLNKVALRSWVRDPVVEEISPALVMSVEGKTLHVRIGKWNGTIDPDGYAWTKQKAEDLVRRGDLVDVKVTKLDQKAGTFTAKLDQALVPTGVQGAVLAIDNRTGQVLAMIGGSSFASSMFNRALQAQRQVGSLFKPIVFTAAIDKGMTAADIIEDSPKSYLPGPNQPVYEPKNYENDYKGDMTLREVLAHSRNVPTVKLMELLTPDAVIPYARSLGIKSPIPPYLSTAIGSAEGTLIEMTSAYSAYPNQGVRMEPIFVVKVTDREGNVLEENYPEPHEALKADTSAILTSMMTSVIKEGTAGSVSLNDPKSPSFANYIPNWPLAGKTGTTDDFTDAWFVGFDPDITIGVWVGYDQKKTLGDKMTGANVALPVWSKIMKSWVDRRRTELAETPAFLRPSNVVDYTMPNGKVEVFIAGTAPGKRVEEKR